MNVVNKVCSCGKVWNQLPKEYKVQTGSEGFDGIYFNCTCKSTLFIPAYKVEGSSLWMGFSVMMVTLSSVIGLMLVMSGCQSSTPSASSDTLSVPPTLSAPVVVVTPTVSPTASPSPSPSPSPSHTFTGGGIQANPYLVSTAQDVAHIGDFPAAYFQLTQSIDMSGVTLTAIPTFSGAIKGMHFQLNNLTLDVNGSANAALITNLTGIVTGLYFQNLTSRSQYGFATTVAYNVYGTITDSMILSGTITSPQGGNGQNTGTGNPFYVNFVTGATVNTDQATVDFNGHSFYGVF